LSLKLAKNGRAANSLMSGHSDFDPDSDLFEKARQETVEHALWIPEGASEDLQRAKRQHSQYRYLLVQITQAAKQHAAKAGITDKLQFQYDILHRAVGLVDCLRSALIRDFSYDDPRKDWNFWRHERFPFYQVKNRKVPYIDRSQLEDAVVRYLELPYRAQAIDRLFIEVLVAAEMYAYGDEMWNEHVFDFAPARSPLKDAMTSVYAQLSSEGVISARHILEEVKKAAAQGVVWPGSLYAMLDDIVARSARF
jgi:hypothetical protein